MYWIMILRLNILTSLILIVILFLAMPEIMTLEKNIHDDCVSSYDADDMIADLLNSKEYIDGTITERKDMVTSLLDQLYKDKLIINYSFHSTGDMFSYTYPDGSLGGIQIEGVNDSHQGVEPLN